ncbi:putative HVA22-like protein g isoform X1 [Musa acuminata AAA Group]|uniref:putative HVA22-like protein g isoform X1 n=2 Tax=Musa acuminata AAA Group TaxID=214697 RepID=UPI0031E2D972
MIGSLLSRALLMVFGYVYPAYECYKTVELNKPEIEQLRFWCQYWILVASLTVLERVGDTFISWLPMYSEAKLAFYIYLWYARTKGTTYVYENFFRPYIAKYETEIDRNLLELRKRVGDVMVRFWQKAASYGQTRFFEFLQYVASQSQAPREQGVQQIQQQLQAPSASSVAQQKQLDLSQQTSTVLSRPTSSGGVHPAVSPAQPQAPVPNLASKEQMQVKIIGSPANEDSDRTSQGTVIEDVIRMARTKLRNRTAVSSSSRWENSEEKSIA